MTLAPKFPGERGSRWDMEHADPRSADQAKTLKQECGSYEFLENECIFRAMVYIILLGAGACLGAGAFFFVDPSYTCSLFTAFFGICFPCALLWLVLSPDAMKRQPLIVPFVVASSAMLGFHLAHAGTPARKT